MRTRPAGNDSPAGTRIEPSVNVKPVAILPTVEIARDRLEQGLSLAELLSDVASLAGSRSEARRLAQGGGLRLNDAAEADAQRTVTAADLNAEGVIKLAAGKKKIVLVRPV